MAVNLIVNGKTVVALDPEKNLLRFLRDDLDLKGTKDGCSRGQCGTCMVIINGEPIRACVRKMKMLEGKTVETIEGLANGDKLHPIQMAYLIKQGFQCGFCTPGFIMSTKALLDRNLNPTDDEIKEALKLNLCRCTGYVQIFEAVRLAAKMMSGEEKAELPVGKGWVGEHVIMKQGIEVVTGQKIFTDDFNQDNPLQGRLLFPEYPHALIKSVDTSEALKQPGVVFIATHEHIPGKKTFSEEIYPQEILAIKKVKHIGDPIAVVYAETDEQARAAMKFIKVDYEPLKVIRNAAEGIAEKEIRVHDEFPNDYYTKNLTKGNVVRAFAKADIILEQSFQTQMMEHALMEMESATAEWDDQGRIVVTGPGQNPSHMHKDIANALGFEQEKVRLIVPRSGGSFGKREGCYCHIFAALGTYHTKRPVRVTLNRREGNIYTTKRHPITFHYKLGASKDGKLLALQTRNVLDSGAYNSMGDYVALCTCTMGTGPYEIPNVDLQSKIVFTNKPSGGCFRGFGSTQVTSCMETLMDKLAEKIGMSPFELRRINGLDIGKQTAVGQMIDSACGYIAAVNACEKALNADEMPKPSKPGKKIGVGMAGGFKNMGNGNEWGDCAAAKISLTKQGRLLLISTGIEEGQGHHTVMAQMAAETLSVTYSDIDVFPHSDADFTPPNGLSTNASRMTFIGGNAVVKACSMFKDSLLKYVAAKKGLDVNLLDMESRGVIGLADQSSFFMSYAQVAQMLAESGDEIVEEYFYSAPQCYGATDSGDNVEREDAKHRVNIGFCFGAMVAVVEVDEESGEVEVKRMYAANDLGRVVNPELVRGQIIGAVMMGVGMALSENYIVKDGYDVTKELKDVGILRTVDTPEIKTMVIEEPHPYGPFNAKGFGEMAVNPTPPAILNAIYNAVGVRINSLPVDAKKLAAAIKSPDRSYENWQP